MAAIAGLTAAVALASMLMLPSFGPPIELTDDYAEQNEPSQQNKEKPLNHSGLYEDDLQQNASLYSTKVPDLWPNKTMPYIIDKSFSPEDKKIIAEVIAEFNNRSCVKMRPYREGDPNYIVIWENYFRSSSPIGFKGGVQVVNLLNCCQRRGQIIHELLHAWGFHHQHSVVGRDQHVRINWENVEPELVKNFKLYDAENFGLPYDYDSVLHYDRYAFTKNGEPTIEPLKEGVEIGQRERFSDMDIIKLNMLYDCPFVFANKTTNETNNKVDR